MKKYRKPYQKEIQKPQEVYWEIAKHIQQSRAEFMHYPDLIDALKDDVGCMRGLFTILEQNRSYERVVLNVCLDYVSSGNCPKDKIVPLKEAIEKFIIYMLEIEKFFEYIDRKSYFYERLEYELSKI